MSAADNSNDSINLSPTGDSFRKRLIRAFYRQKGALWSLRLFLILFVISVAAPLWCNDKPILVRYQNQYYFPLFVNYYETQFGGDFETYADYLDPFIRENITTNGNFAIYLPNPYDDHTLNEFDTQPNPAPPSSNHLLGTDDIGQDILARLVYGFRNSVLFALVLTFMTTILGIFFGAIQGFFGGKVDLILQRIFEIWGGLPELYLLIIFASFFEPSLLLLLLLLTAFSWLGLSDYVRAEFLKNRQMDYVMAAKSMGASNKRIMWQHILPNSLTPVLAFLPFRISGAVLALTSLDFLGLGVPGDQAGLGNLLAQGKDNLDAWWIALPTFIVLTVMLLLLVIIGDGLRRALDVYS
ncbi:MAG: ABC transporter permease [Neisseriaceae bacterium]|nr:ABC transporter permease [Neisseriaceae bacterium]